MNQNTKQEGFTLLELAIALLIIGLLLGGILGPLSTQMEQKDRQGTQEQLNDIGEALLGFAISNGRLPCPDTDNDGIENRTGTDNSCAASVDGLPWVDLGVAEFDAWREHFTYAVTSDFADDLPGAHNVDANRPNPCGTATVGVSFELCSGGNITIENEAGNTVVDKIPALVFSGGKESYTGSSLEIENTNGDVKFVHTDYRQEPAKEYDDLMIWLSPNILKNRMVQAGRLP